MIKVKAALIGHMNVDEKEKFISNFINQTAIRETFSYLADKEIERLLAVRTDDYDCPSWSEKQADRNGELRAWRRIKDLMTVKERE